MVSIIYGCAEGVDSKVFVYAAPRDMYFKVTVNFCDN